MSQGDSAFSFHEWALRRAERRLRRLRAVVTVAILIVAAALAYLVWRPSSEQVAPPTAPSIVLIEREVAELRNELRSLHEDLAATDDGSARVRRQVGRVQAELNCVKRVLSALDRGLRRLVTGAIQPEEWIRRRLPDCA